jgi:hypothetical protein
MKRRGVRVNANSANDRRSFNVTFIVPTVRWTPRSRRTSTKIFRFSLGIPGFTQAPYVRCFCNSSGRFSLTAKDLDSSSLEGHRTIADLFFIVESAVRVVGRTQGFVLRGVDDASIIIQRNTTGNIEAGRYMIRKFHSVHLHVSLFIASQSLMRSMHKLQG